MRSSAVCVVLMMMASLASADEPAVQPPGLTPTAAPPTWRPAPIARSPVVLSPLRSPKPGSDLWLRQRGEVDEGLATMLPCAATLGSWALVLGGASAGNGALVLTGFVGTLVGPSAGRWYIGEAGALGLGLRAGGATLMLIGLARAIAEDGGCDFEDECDSGGSSNSGATAGLLLSGLGLYVGATLYDLVTAGSAARDHNAKVRYAHSRLQVAPMVQPGGGGVMLGGRF